MKHKLAQIRIFLLAGFYISVKLLLRRTLVPVILYSAFLFTLNSCYQHKNYQRNIERSFYFWKSVFKLSDYEKQTLAAMHVKTLYIKLFDVDWDNTAHQPLPVAQIRFNDTTFLQQNSINIIPVVFITNSCIQKIDSSQANNLGKKISTLIQNICIANQITTKEIQIDCDWTESTKQNYFRLLSTIKSQIANSKLQVSCTIRLHQIKYSAKTGVPPVNRGLLMVYNMGNLKDPATKNSILETSELKKYISNLSSYPLPLDVALPLFEWKVLFRSNAFIGLIENLPDSFLNNSSVKKISSSRFQFEKDTTLNGYSFKKDDILRKEESNYEEIMSAASLLNHKLQTPPDRISRAGTNFKLSLFHLDSLILSKYSQHEMENIFNSLR